MPLSIVGKVLHDQWRVLAVWTVVSGVFAAFYLSLYPSIGAVEQMRQLLDSMPPALRAMFAAEGVDIGTPAGYLNVELFTFMVPLLVLAVSLPAAGGATAGEEERGTLELLLANPIPRWRVAVEKFIAIVVETAIVVAGIWIALALTARVAGIDLALDRVAAALASAAILGLVIGALAMAIGAVSGSRMLSIGIALAVAVGGFFINALAPLVEGLKAWRVISPHYHYIGYDPLANGLDAGHAVIRLVATGVVLGFAVLAFERRDLRA
jgi:ABC-2 type transport system permease protein